MRARGSGVVGTVVAAAVVLGAASGCGVDHDNLGAMEVPPPAQQPPPSPPPPPPDDPEPRRAPGAPPAAVPEPHAVVLSGTNIDKDMYVWLERQPVNELVFYAGERTGTVNLTEALRWRGVTAGILELKLGNGDCFGASGDLAISVDGQARWTATVDKRLSDCGWQLEAHVRVDLIAGTVQELSRWVK
jgi:hypothetical protein